MFRFPANFVPTVAATTTSSVRSTFLAPVYSFSSATALVPAVTNFSSFQFVPFSCTGFGLFANTQSLQFFAHWYAGRHKKHRWAREKRYHPKYQINKIGRNAFSRRLHWKTNRWNYKQSFRDMP
jgi:hypothetical protein